jgi:hypothetical protein
VREVEARSGRGAGNGNSAKHTVCRQLPPGDNRGQYVYTVDHRAQRLHARTKQIVVEGLKRRKPERKITCAERSRKVEYHRLSCMLASEPAAYNLLRCSQNGDAQSRTPDREKPCASPRIQCPDAYSPSARTLTTRPRRPVLN